MRNAGLLVLTVGLLHCSAVPDGPPVEDAPPAYSDEAARTDLVCSEPASGDEDVCETEEPLSGLGFACMALVGVAIAYGCHQGVFEQWCPPGTTKTAHDPWDSKQTITFSCTQLEIAVCSLAETSGGEPLRHICLAL